MVRSKTTLDIINFKDVLFFYTGFDRIPAHEIPKPIDVNFDKEIIIEHFDVYFNCNTDSNKHRKGVKNIHKFRKWIWKYLVTLNLILVLRFC